MIPGQYEVIQYTLSLPRGYSFHLPQLHFKARAILADASRADLSTFALALDHTASLPLPDSRICAVQQSL